MFSENKDIKNVQKEILFLLKKFHMLCIKNGIKYTLHGGSMLGAVREEGFIPWDDDADVAMLRSEYVRFCKCITTDPHEEIYLDNFSDKMYKVWMKKKGHPIVWIDIFVYDFISEKKLPQKMKIAEISLLTPFVKNAVSIQQFRANGRAVGIKKYIYEFLYLCGKIFPQKQKIKLIDYFEQKTFQGKKKYIHRSNDQLFAMKMIIKADYMKNYILVKFENIELMVSKNYHEILVSSYGDDYMIPKKNQENDIIHSIARENS